MRLASLLGVLAGGAVGIVATALGGGRCRAAGSRTATGCPGSDAPPSPADASGRARRGSRTTFTAFPRRSRIPSGAATPRARSTSVRREVRRSLRLPLDPRASNGLRQLTTVVPPALASGSGGFEYYARAPVSGNGRVAHDAGGRRRGAESLSAAGGCGRREPGLPPVRLDESRVIGSHRRRGAMARTTPASSKGRTSARSAPPRSTSTARERCSCSTRLIVASSAGRRGTTTPTACRSPSTDGSRT